MISRGRQLRCLLVYAPEVESCSALHGIMWELQRKVREFHQSAETFWLHNGSIVNRNLIEFSNWKPPMLLPWSWLEMIPLLACIISFHKAIPHILFVVVVSFMPFSKCPRFSQVRAIPPLIVWNPSPAHPLPPFPFSPSICLLCIDIVGRLSNLLRKKLSMINAVAHVQFFNVSFTVSLVCSTASCARTWLPISLARLLKSMLWLYFRLLANFVLICGLFSGFENF